MKILEIQMRKYFKCILGRYKDTSFQSKFSALEKEIQS